jgi:hypothetical protein
MLLVYFHRYAAVAMVRYGSYGAIGRLGYAMLCYAMLAYEWDGMGWDGAGV